jgi:hypothetical protein
MLDPAHCGASLNFADNRASATVSRAAMTRNLLYRGRFDGLVCATNAAIALAASTWRQYVTSSASQAPSK